MTRTLCTLLFTALLSCAFAADRPLRQAQDRPNVIVILADDLGYADVGFQDVVAPDGVCTPNLDSLAQSGVVFRNAYSTSPICSASRLGLSTGRYHQRWGGYWYGEGGLPTAEQTIAEMMKEAGYATMKVGKTHLNKGPKEHPLDHGFDHYLGFEHHSWDFNLLSEKDVAAYERKQKGSSQKMTNIGVGPLTRDRGNESFENTTTTEVFGNESVKFIQANKDKPFYLQLEFNAMHTPLYKAPDQLEKKYGIPHKEFDRDAGVWEYPYWDPIQQPDYKQWYGQTCHLKIMDPYGRKKYLAHLELMDQVIGHIMDTVKNQNLDDNTLIFFSVDNGGSHQSYANNGELNVFKYCLMDGGIKVPMFISWPARFKAGRSDAVVTHRDLFATLSDITGIVPKNALDGKSLVPLIDGDVEELHSDPLLWDTGPRQKNWVVRQGDWKLVFRGTPRRYLSYELDKQGLVTNLLSSNIPEGLQLYNLAEDPGERQNLIDQYPEKVAAMEKIYNEWRVQMADPTHGHKAQ